MSPRTRLAMLAFAAALVGGTPLQAQMMAPNDWTGVDAALTASENHMWEWFLKKDAASFMRNIDHDYFGVDIAGRQPFSPQLIDKELEGCTIPGFALDDMRIVHPTPDVAILSYRATMQGTCAGKPIPRAWVSSTWVRHGKQWLAVYHQESEIGG